MARPREFDTNEALDAAMQAFWLRGYEATSLADLMAATGLQKGSIYKAFKDKHSLFVSALRRYLERIDRFHRDRIERAESPRIALAAWLRELVETYGGYEDCRGCFAMNALTELAPHDAEVKQLVAAQTERLHELLCRTIAKGQGLGEFRTDVSAEDLSLLLLSLAYGIIASSKGQAQGRTARERLQRQAEIAIAVMR